MRADPGDIAWLSAPVCAVLLLVAIPPLAPALGQALFPAHQAGATFWPYWASYNLVRPEPTEHAGYLIALLAPLLLAGVVLHVARRGREIRRLTLLRAAVRWSEALLLGFLAACILGQRAIDYGGTIYSLPLHQHLSYFTIPTLAVALVLTGVVAVGVRRRALVAWLAALVGRDGRGWRVAVGAAVLALIATWLLTAVNFESTIAHANVGVTANMPVWLDETFAMLDGQAPLVGFHSQYSVLWPYVTAGIMSISATSLGVFVAVMIAGAAATLLCTYAVIRRVVRRPLYALVLYVPFISTGFFTELGPPGNRYGPSNLFPEFPMRYAGPYALAWLTARHLDGARPRRPVSIFAVAGLVVINNVELGVPALGATVAAHLWTGGPLSWRRGLRLLGELAAGLAAAAALTSALTLAVAGSLPDFGSLAVFARLYGIDGFGMLPMPTLGFHLVLYVTFSAALVVATVRAVGGDRELLTGMLAWAGTFGLGAGSYFVGRSHPEVLVDLFSPWAFALVLLVVVVVRALVARPSGRPRLSELAVLAGFAVAVCSVAQTPVPWTQIERLEHTSPARPLRDPEMERLVAGASRPGEPVAIFKALGHRTAYEIGRRNVSPYASLDSMPLVQQLDEVVRRMRAAGGHLMFFDYHITPDEAIARLRSHGFAVVQITPSGMIEMEDRGRSPSR